MKMAIAVLILAGCAYDPGGSIREREYQLITEPSAPITGYCASACTMRLSRDCVTAGAVLVFHRPTPDRPRHRAAVAAHYPPAIAEWFMTSTGPRVMSGAEAISLGATPC